MTNISGSRSLLIHVSASLKETNTTFKITSRLYLPLEVSDDEESQCPSNPKTPVVRCHVEKAKGEASLIWRNKSKTLYFILLKGEGNQYS